MCITVTQALMLNLSKTFALFCIFQTQFWSQQECKKVTAVLPCDVKYLHKMLDEGHDYIIRISNYRLCEYLWCLLNCSIADISFVELSDYSNAIYLLFCPNFVCVNNLYYFYDRKYDRNVLNHQDHEMHRFLNTFLVLTILEFFVPSDIYYTIPCVVCKSRGN